MASLGINTDAIEQIANSIENQISSGKSNAIKIKKVLDKEMQE